MITVSQILCRDFSGYLVRVGWCVKKFIREPDFPAFLKNNRKMCSRR